MTKTSLFVRLSAAVLVSGVLLPSVLHAQESPPSDAAIPDDTALLDLSLEDLLDMPVTVASGNVKKTQSESPGIVTVITSRDIERWGSRDLIDVLRMVPGLEPESDSDGHVGIGVRGNWAGDGKILVLVDGMEMNDDLYGGYHYGHRFPLAIIDRIEIIRGPGSAMYGGYAELGVISIITKKPTSKNTYMYDAGAGVMFDDQEATLGRALGTAYYGGLYDNVRFNLSASGEMGHSSNQIATDSGGYTWDMSDDKTSLVFLNGNLKVYGLTIDFVVDRYHVDFTYPDPYYNVSDSYTDHYSYLASAKYDIPVTEKLTITPAFRFKYMEPWYMEDAFTDDGEPYPDWYYHVVTEKYSGELAASWDALKVFNLSGGVTYDHFRGTDEFHNEEFNGTNKSSFNNVAVFLQGIGTSKILDYAAGVRFNWHEQFGVSVVPRLALTKAFLNNYHVKLLGAMAYKAPTLVNLGYNPDVKPEKTATAELEIGARAKDVASLTTNVFFNTIGDAIIYSTNPSNEYWYNNEGRISTWGIEAAGKIKASIVEFDLAYSLYQVLTSNVAPYEVPDDGMTLGFATHKITSSLSINPFDRFYLTPSFVFLSPRWSIPLVEYDEVGNESFVYEKTDPETLLDFTVLYKDLGFNGFDVSLSFHNILGEGAVFVQPYLGYEAPVPGPGREVMLRLTYSNF